MELRDIEIFLTLAEELHFGKTAERLHVSVARVSQAIKKQERTIGAELFIRDSRNVRLTPAGERLRDDLGPIYQALKESMERASLRARGKTAVLRLGMIGLDLQAVRPLIDRFAELHPTCEVQIRNIGFGDAFAPLRADDVDLALVWLPVREPDLTVGPTLYTEPVMLAVAAGSPLATRDSVSYEDLGDQTVMIAARPGYWREALVPTRTPSGRLIRTGPEVTNTTEMLAIIANGEAVSPVHAHAIWYLARPDIAYVPIHDAPPAHWALIWRTAAETDLIRAFALSHAE